MTNSINTIIPQVIQMTPALARRYLKGNTSNRKPRNHHVERYANDMRAGLWAFAAEPIKVADDGTLLDGQHRLMALAEQDETFSLPMLVVTGLPKESQRVMDQGVKRTPGDQLMLAGIKNATNVASAAKWVIILDNGLLFRDNKVQAATASTPRIEGWCRQHPALVEQMSNLARPCSRTEFLPSVLLAVATMITRLWGFQTAQDFIDPLAKGGAPKGSPLNAADQTMRSIRRRGLKMPARDQMALLIRAFNSHILKEHRARFTKPVGGKWTEKNFPVLLTPAEVTPR